MVQTTRPVHSNVAFVAIQARGAFHAATCTDAAEFEQPIKYRTVITDIVLALFLAVLFHIVGCDFREEVNVFVGVELGHLVL